jgi:hypothetical protein
MLSVPLSLIPKAWRFLADPDTFSYMRLAGKSVETTAILMPAVRQEYYRDVLFAGEIPWHESVEMPACITPMFYGEYVVYHQRWSPAFVGFAVAVALREAYHSTADTINNVSKANSTASMLMWKKVLHSIMLMASIALVALPLTTALNPPTPEVRRTVLADPPLVDDFVVTVLSRTLYAMGWGCILYRCLLPKDHPLRLKSVAAFLELQVFQFIGRHTYCMYMLHYLVLHVVSFYWLSPRRMEGILGPTSIDTQFTEYCLRFSLSYGLTLLSSVPIANWFEQPMLRIFQRHIRKLEKFMFADVNKTQ